MGHRLLKILGLIALLVLALFITFYLVKSSHWPLRNDDEKSEVTVTDTEIQQTDENLIYESNGYLSKTEYPMDEDSIRRAAERFRYIYEENIKGKDMKVYYSVIPDKNYFLAEEAGHPAMDYDDFYSGLKENIDFMEYIDITGLLSIEDYYKTDTHWRQERLEKVAKKLSEEMGVSLDADYEEKELEIPFYGVYYEEAALSLPADTIYYLTNDILEQCKVYDFQNDREISIYDMEKALGRDPYEIYLSGAISLITIENPNATTGKELIIFRDSFGSSLAPLLVEGYEKITLVDIRYLRSDMLSKFITFENQDVLFLYSTLVLNNSETLK